MKPAIFIFVLAIAGLVSCSPSPPAPQPPVNEYLVVGNDKGFRNDYIDQTNLVTIDDNSVTVRSLRSADNARSYPIVNGYVEGGADPRLHWRMSTLGNDTIALLDTSRSTSFYLKRLHRVDSLPGVVGLLTSGELVNGKVGTKQFVSRRNYVYLDMGQGAGCLIDRGYFPYFDWSKAEGKPSVSSRLDAEHYVRMSTPGSLWRLYNRFAQPILVHQNEKYGLRVMPLDSISEEGDTLYGHAISDISFKQRNKLLLCRSASAAAEVTPSILSALAAAPAKVHVAPAKVRNQYRHRWEKGEDATDFITVYEEDLKEMRLQFSAPDRLELMVGDAEIFSHTYRLHSTAPYLVVGEECENDAYWHYELHGDSLTFRVPVRVELPVNNQEPVTIVDGNGKEISIPVGRWYAVDEWRGTYVLNSAELK